MRFARTCIDRGTRPSPSRELAATRAAARRAVPIRVRIRTASAASAAAIRVGIGVASTVHIASHRTVATTTATTAITAARRARCAIAATRRSAVAVDIASAAAALVVRTAIRTIAAAIAEIAAKTGVQCVERAAARLPAPAASGTAATTTLLIETPMRHQHGLAMNEAHRRLHRIGLTPFLVGLTSALTALLFARRLETHRRHQAAHLIVLEFLPAAALQTARQRNRTVPRAKQTAHHQTDRLEHPPHFAVTSFGERDVVPVIGAFAAAVADAQKVGGTVVELDAGEQLLAHALSEFADDPYRILALDAIARVHEAVRQIARGREHQQALGIEVEAANREPFRALHRRQLVEYRRAAFGVRVTDDLAGRLVIQQHARRLVLQLALDRLAVDADEVGRHDALADMRRFAIHRHAARDDQLFHLAARAHARFGQYLVQLRCIVVGSEHALGLRGGSATPQHRRAHTTARTAVRCVRRVVGIECRRRHIGEQVVVRTCVRRALWAALAGAAPVLLAPAFTRRAIARGGAPL